MNMLYLAFKISKKYHKGQKDKGGEDYFLHPLAVAKRVTTREEKITALLHDTLEDTSLTEEELLSFGFEKKIVDAVVLLTQKKEISRQEDLSKIKNDPLARTVKLADLSHNSEISRIPEPTKKDIERVEKYKREIEYLKGHLL